MKTNEEIAEGMANGFNDSLERVRGWWDEYARDAVKPKGEALAGWQASEDRVQHIAQGLRACPHLIPQVEELVKEELKKALENVFSVNAAANEGEQPAPREDGTGASAGSG